jgi:hypothetical protein
MFSGLLLVTKQELCDLHKTIFLELELINKNDVIVVAMATMTFQHGRHFGFKRILLIELKITGTIPPIGLAYDWMKPNFTSSRACSTSRHACLCCETFSRDHFGEVQ